MRFEDCILYRATLELPDNFSPSNVFRLVLFTAPNHLSSASA